MSYTYLKPLHTEDTAKTYKDAFYSTENYSDEYLQNELEAIVKEVIAKQLRMDVSEISDDAAIVQDLGADSLDIVEMLMTLESEFGIIVPDEDVMELKTVRAVAEYIESHT